MIIISIQFHQLHLHKFLPCMETIQTPFIHTSIQFHQLYLHKFFPCVRANQVSQIHFPCQASHTLVNNIYSNIQSKAHIHCNIFSSTTFTSNIQSEAHIRCITKTHCSSNIITSQYTMRSTNHHINSSSSIQVPHSYKHKSLLCT